MIRKFISFNIVLVLLILWLGSCAELKISQSSPKGKGTIAVVPAVYPATPIDITDMAETYAEARAFTKYPRLSDYYTLIDSLPILYPDICSVDTIGQTVAGKYKLAIKISDNVAVDEKEVKMLMSFNMHGDENETGVMGLRLPYYIAANYGIVDQVTNIIDNVELWICPIENLDGYWNAGGDTSILNARRWVTDGIDSLDLNRAYPDPNVPDTGDTIGLHTEVKDMMFFLESKGFTMSANYHCGQEVVNYPWDYSLTPYHVDSAWFNLICKEYADTAQSLLTGYFETIADSGYVRGADWAVINGGRQDYVTYYLEGRETTIEIWRDDYTTESAFYHDRMSTVNDSLDLLWGWNRQPMLNWITQATYGIKGTVTDINTGAAIEATVTVNDHDNAQSIIHAEADSGDYYRLIAAGTYSLTFSAAGYDNVVETGVTVVNGVATTLNVQMGVLDPETDSKYMKSGGSFLKFGGSYITYGGTTALPGGSVSDSVTILMWEDFEDFSTTSDITDNFPNGIPHDSLSAHMDNFLAVFSDDVQNLPTWNKYVANNADIVEFDGGNTLQSWYVSGRCCTEAATDSADSNGGTGIDLRVYVDPAGTIPPQHADIVLSWNIYFEAGYLNPIAGGRGTKMLGAYPYNSGNSTVSKMMLITGAGLNLNIQHYPWHFGSTPEDPIGSDYLDWYNLDTAVVETGRWHHFDLRMYSGTIGNLDGMLEVFVDGVFMGYTQTGLRFLHSTLLDTGFGMMSISTFMGGDDPTSASPQTQWNRIDDIVIWVDDALSTPQTGVPSSIGRVIDLPTECNWNTATKTRN